MTSNTGERIRIRPLNEGHLAWVEALVRDRWGAEIVVVHGDIFRPAALPGFVAEWEDRLVGLVTLKFHRRSCEVVTLDSLREGCGVGTALLDASKDAASQRGCERLWLVTTNDNLHALRFYQRFGFRLVALRPGAVEESRKIKPSIPLTGDNGIPLRDELELELALSGRPGVLDHGTGRPEGRGTGRPVTDLAIYAAVHLVPRGRVAT